MQHFYCKNINLWLNVLKPKHCHQTTNTTSDSCDYLGHMSDTVVHNNSIRLIIISKKRYHNGSFVDKYMGII